MLSLARNGYTASAVDAALHAVNRRMYFRYDLLDGNGNWKKALTTVTTGNVTYDTTQQVKRTATFTLMDDPDINYLTDRIKPWARLMMPNGGFAEFPLGVFLLSTPPRQTDNALVVTRQIQGYDYSQILLNNKVTDRYVVAQGTNYIGAVKTLLQNAGIPGMNLTSTSLGLPTALDWKIGTDYLTIINTLLQGINYKTLWFDENGVAVAQPYTAPSQLPASYTYQDDSQSVMYPTVQQSLDLFAQPNEWVLVVSETDRSVMTSTYTNTNSNSPTSTVSRGMTVVKVVTGVTAANQSTLDSMAYKQAYEDSQVYEKTTFQTAIMPFHQDFDVLQINFSALGISDKYSETGWSFDLVAGAQMNHTVQRVVSV